MSTPFRVRSRAASPLQRTVAAATSALVALTGAVALGAGPYATASATAATVSSIDPFAAAGGFSVYSRGNAVLDNHEVEGSVAVGGQLTVRRDGGGYAILHQAAGTADYSIPTVDGDPTRLLIGSYSTTSGLVEIRNGGIPGGTDASLEGYLKVADVDPAFGLYERGGWVRYRTAEGDVPAIDATNQRWPGGQSTVYTRTPSVAAYVEAGAQGSYDEVAQCLAALPGSAEAHQVTVAENAGDRKVLSELAPDRVNVLRYEDIAGGNRMQFSPGSPTPSASNPLVIQVPAGTTAVDGATFDPQGAYSRYVMWDLSQVEGPVTLGASGRVDGSVYAPFADLTVDAAPLDGQILADTLHLLGGETHAYLFAGVLPCAPAAPTGGFSVAKELLGSAAGLVPAGTEFTVAYAYEMGGVPTSGTVTVLADGTFVEGPQNLPVGTVVTFTEIDLPDVAGVVWGAPTFSPESVTISDGVDAQVTVTNTAAPVVVRVGGFSIQKAVTGEAADLVPEGTEFTVAYSYELAGAPVTGTLVVTADGTVVNGPQNLPAGTVVSFDEVSLPDIDGVVWGAPVFSPDTLTVAADENPTIVLTNTATDAPAGGFSVRKVVTGEASGLVPGGTEFTVSYSYELGGVPTSGTLAVLADGTVVNGPQNLPVGTVVTFAEVSLPAIDGVVWGAPAFSPATVTIADGTDAEVMVTNTATDLPAGGFSLRKAVTGTATGLVPEGTEFTVRYSYELAGVPTSGTATVLADGTVVNGPQNLPVGTEVTFGEINLPTIDGVVWGAPAFSPESLTIADGVDAQVAVTNTADAVVVPVGGFSLRKVVEGAATGLVPEGAEFTVAYSYEIDGTPTGGRLTVLADGTVVNGPQNLVAGTVVTFEEIELPSIDGVNWGTAVFSPESVTIGDGTSPEVTLTNRADLAVGGFSLQKVVTGEAAGLVPGGTEFTVSYSYELDGVPTSGTLTVLADGTLVDGPQNLPVGTVVTFEEIDLPSIDGVVWGAPAFSPAAVTVADGTSAVVTVTNTADVVAAQVGSFSILKKIDGPNAAKVTADTEFTVTVSGTVNGEHQEGTLTVRADGTVVDGPANLPAGTVVELEETSLPTIDGVSWGTPVFTVDGEKVSSITIGAGQVVEVTLTNTAGSGLAVTGTGALGIAAAALLLLGGGAVLLVGARRRRA